LKKISKKCCPYIDTLVSGAPILQNGSLAGAVTHVFTEDPTMGYGIFAQTMLEQGRTLAAQAQQDAA